MDGPLESGGASKSAPQPTYIIAQQAPRRWGVFRLFTVLLGGVFLGSTASTCMTMQANQEGPFGRKGPKVGVVEVVGAITSARETVADLARFAFDDSIEAVVVRVDSPGGSVGPSQEIYAAMRRLSEKKPVVASMGSVAASGGFWISLAADEVFANPGTITGSIGVIVQIPDFSKLKKVLRFDMRTYKSGPQKDLGNSLEPERPADRAILQSMVDDIYEQFVQLTAERRGLSKDDVVALADGRVFSGRAAKEAGLVDAMGGLVVAAARALQLAKEGSDEPLPEGEMILVYPPEDLPPFFELLGARLSESIAAGVLKSVQNAEALQVELR